MAASLSGRTFLARGGNGQLTAPQLALHAATGLPMEHVIETAAVRGRFESLPNCYKVDLADAARMVAIEVDGRSHDQPKWRFLDRRKSDVLNALGWTVVRFRNEHVLADPAAVARRVTALAEGAYG